MAQMDLTAFKGKAPAQAFAALNPSDDGLADGIGSSYGIIGYKGKNWTLRYHGEKKPFLRPDDGTPIGYIDVIILRSARQKSKSYYAAFDPNASEGARPLCASLDGVTPDADVQQKQAEHCALCPRNQWRTNAAGRRERDCNDYKRLAVLVMPTQTAKMFGKPLMEPVFLRVPPGSLDKLLELHDTMTGQGFHSATYVTRISFDPNQAHPSMIFTPHQPLTDAEGPVILPLVEDALGKRITGEDVVTTAPAGPALAAPTSAPQIAAPAQPVQQVQQPVVQQPVQQPIQPAPQPVTIDLVANAPIDTGLTSAQMDAKPVETGLLGVPAQTTPQAAAPQPAQTPSDTGEPQESDAALDDRIASLMTK